MCDWFVCHFPIHMWFHSFLRRFISNVIHCDIKMSHVTYELDSDLRIRISHSYVTHGWFLCQFPIHMWRDAFVRHITYSVIHCDINMSHITYELEIDLRISRSYVTRDSFLCQFPIHMLLDAFLCHFISDVIHSDIRMSGITYELEIDLRMGHLYVTCDSFLCQFPIDRDVTHSYVTSFMMWFILI